MEEKMKVICIYEDRENRFGVVELYPYSPEKGAAIDRAIGASAEPIWETRITDPKQVNLYSRDEIIWILKEVGFKDREVENRYKFKRELSREVMVDIAYSYRQYRSVARINEILDNDFLEVIEDLIVDKGLYILDGLSIEPVLRRAYSESYLKRKTGMALRDLAGLIDSFNSEWKESINKRIDEENE